MIPTVILSFVEDEGKLKLHQYYVDALGNGEWRPVQTRSAKNLETGKKYADCQAFDANAGIPFGSEF